MDFRAPRSPGPLMREAQRSVVEPMCLQLDLHKEESDIADRSRSELQNQTASVCDQEAPSLVAAQHEMKLCRCSCLNRLA